MILEIVAKPDPLLNKGITNEAEAVYLPAELRKLLEHQQAKTQYKYLNCHCNWALHGDVRGVCSSGSLE